MILPVLLFARLTLSFSLSFPRVPFPVLSVPRTFSLPLAPLLPVRRLPRERDGALYLSRSRSYSPLVCTAVRHLLNCVRRCPLLLPPSPALSSLPLGLFSLLFLHVVVFIFSSSAPGRRSSSLARAGERHRTTENKVFLRFPVLSSLAPSLSRHFRVEYTRERRGFISASARGMREGARTERNSSSFSVSLSRSLSLFSLSASLSVSGTANQTVLHESRPLKRIVFHARRVTD